MSQNAYKHVWLINYLYNHPRKTLKEISDQWMNAPFAEGYDLPARTFHKWKDAIFETYGLEIVCDNYHQYYIRNTEELNSNRIHKWLIRTLSVSNSLLTRSALNNRILLESIPSGEKFLDEIMSAIKACRVVEFDYVSYYKQQSKHNFLHPYCIKLFEQRWYVVGFRPSSKPEDAGIRTFSLDNMENLSISDEVFKYPEDFDPDIHFKNCYGIITGYDTPVEEIRIKVDKYRAAYWLSVPLHESQKIQEETDDYIIFTLKLKPMNDFYQRLFRDTTHIEILSPKTVRDEFAEIVRQMYNMYNR